MTGVYGWDPWHTIAGTMDPSWAYVLKFYVYIYIADDAMVGPRHSS